jgi:hypothetical protein
VEFPGEYFVSDVNGLKDELAQRRAIHFVLLAPVWFAHCTPLALFRGIDAINNPLRGLAKRPHATTAFDVVDFIAQTVRDLAVCLGKSGVMRAKKLALNNLKDVGGQKGGAVVHRTASRRASSHSCKSVSL